MNTHKDHDLANPSAMSSSDTAHSKELREEIRRLRRALSDSQARENRLQSVIDTVIAAVGGGRP